MPEFLEDPSVLTKDRLKSELLAHNVALPPGEQRKDVYVQLYLQHLTARNRPPPPAQPPPPGPATNSRAPPDFSSDDEREPTPVLSAAGRGRGGGAAAGRKATKKTDKPRSEEKDDLNVTELTNEELLSQLVKYGVNPGPIVGTTRKLYEKKLLKLREHGPESRSSTPLPAVSSSAENARQNGNDDSDRYSDNEEELKLEKREPLKGRTKTPVTLKQRRVEHNQVETAEQLRVDGEVISESLPIAETIMPSSNETLVVNRVTGNFKHAAPILPINEFSDIPRRTPKKPLTRAEVGEITLTEDRRIERDILKEMFPFEAATPTGISASCRRPIKGAAGRPLELGDFRMEGTFSSKYVPKYAPLADDKTEKTRKGRSVPMWIKILLFVIVAVFLFLVYQAMETNQGNPFSNLLNNGSTAFQAKAN
ncbi:thymopoietin isoform X3 [Notamacropus eugenii]|uniref:thymopoietin isoform X3 n=1 Tax=Notamacropus eugenii TaxID=9315 RepID=UPI003B6715A9